MIIKTTAIALAVAPYSETSQVVVWLTAGHGKIVTLLKGAQRSKSVFLGQYGLCATSELLFHPRWQSALHIARECAMVAPRRYLHADWRAAVGAMYLAWLLNHWLAPHFAMPHCFALVNHVLDELAQADFEPLLPWFELRLLALAGMAPGLHACCKCRRPQETAAPESWFFSAAQGGLLCRLCGEKAPPHDQGQAIAPDTLAVLQFWQAAPDGAAARRLRCAPQQWLAAMAVLGEFLRHHLDTPPRARQVMLAALQSPPVMHSAAAGAGGGNGKAWQ